MNRRAMDFKLGFIMRQPDQQLAWCDMEFPYSAGRVGKEAFFLIFIYLLFLMDYRYL